MDYYSILGVLPSATLEEIKGRYRIIAMRTHPDRNGGDEKLTHRFQQATEAYETLSDAEKREAYDRRALTSLIEDPSLAARAAWEDFISSTLTQTNHHKEIP
jgi:curved DNA-binding protein CbpA